MPRFEPFAGIRYAVPDGQLSDLVAPPYDVIGPDERAALEARSDHNAVRVELPRDGEAGNRYVEADRLFTAWLAEGILVRDRQPALYLTRTTFTMDDGSARSTHGVLGALGLEQPGEGILPHERTTTKDKADRLDILRTTRVNLSPIWGLCPTPGLGTLCRADGPPDAAATDDDGVLHELWVLTDPDRVAAVVGAIAANPLVIADGHHRFEVGNAYRAEDGAANGAASILALVVELSEDELVVHPIHRLLTGVPADLIDRLGAWFDIEPGPPSGPDGLGLVTRDGSWLLRPHAAATEAAAADLDSCRLDLALADLPEVEVRFQHGVDHVTAAVEKGEADAAVLLRPATVAQIAATGHGGERMPPKTTFFWPKPRTGLVFRALDER